MKKFVWMLSLGAVLAACGQSDTEEESSGSSEVAPIDVEVLMDDEIQVGEAELKTSVTMAGEPVTEVDEIIFEVWQMGEKERSDMIEKEEGENGVYTADYTFEDDGIYHVQPHVTAEGMHSMPVHDLGVGEVSEEEWQALEEKDEEMESEFMDDEDHGHENDHEHDHEHDHSEVLAITLTPKVVEQGDSETLTVNINEEEDALTDAEVTLEIYPKAAEGDDHDWIDAEEENDGNYKVDYTFSEAEPYEVMIHVENEELHEHEAVSIEVE
ncbi:YtkA-like protein [Salsuginibacillus halophilus]|uniref:YtkA-like protein n=1 Tax=Salsuginibacillus halophilus TaxID=517424 RepID=A0A2P8HLK2_9BACI|nr:FixH family protein [Salsuginibacillus halophilus]PSL47093.1 YtkA-like protein [Salsuginibacillus halophilus]